MRISDWSSDVCSSDLRSGCAGCRHRDIRGRAGSLCREYIDIEGRVNDQTPTELAQDGIEQGKRRIRLSGEKGISLSARVATHFYLLTWRNPLPDIRFKGNYPQNLLATPATRTSAER